ncbi:MAG: response regulator [Actinomycetota bacterium]|nr:response regulator [Actinomycetota bacterium]
MSKKILLVEDSPTQAQRAQLILEREGYNVTLAPDGSEGLERALADQPDLVVTDIVMPNMDGYEMCREIKSRDETSRIPVVMLTTKGDIMDIIKGLGVGADNFITKPYEGSLLVNHIQNIFDNLDLRSKGLLLEDMEIATFNGKVAMTSDRFQILSLLLSTIGVVIHCNVMGLFLLSKDRAHSLYLVSLQPMSETTSDDLTTKVLAAANVLDDGEMTGENVRVTKVVKEEQLPLLEESFPSFISVPLISGGEVIGILTTANTKVDAFQPDDVKHLYQLGLQSAGAFDRIGR